MFVPAFTLRDVLQAGAAEFSRLASGPIETATKLDGTPVTDVDIAIDAFLRRQLSALAPEAAWLSEESAQDSARLGREWIWVVDPLDGTKEFVRGIPECAISVGLVQRGVVRAGAVVNPFTGTGAAAGTDGSWVSWPEVGRGHAEFVETCSTAAASVSRSEVEDGSIGPFLDLVGETRPVGSAANKLLRVACGVDDLTFSVQPKSEWDVCGGIALIEARGMVFSRRDGAAVRFNQANTRIPHGFAAGPSHLVEELLSAIRACPTDQVPVPDGGR